MTSAALFIASLPFAYFMAISSITPGPNNLMLAASGMNFGIRRTLPHMTGVVVGFTALMFLAAFGVGAVYKAYPQAHIMLSVFCAAYILYLAYKIATAGKPEAGTSGARPMTFVQAFMFQFVNPKGLVMALASTSTLLPHAPLAQQCLVLVIMGFLINGPCVTIWAGFGTGMAKLFTSEKSHHIINAILALALIATIPMMLL